MDQKEIKIKTQDGLVDAYETRILESSESSGRMTLSDGTIVNYRQVPIGVVRLKGKWDDKGAPQYLVKFTNTVDIVDFKPELGKPGQK